MYTCSLNQIENCISLDERDICSLSLTENYISLDEGYPTNYILYICSLSQTGNCISLDERDIQLTIYCIYVARVRQETAYL